MSSRILVALRVPATPELAFDVFTREIGAWWRPNALFPINPGMTGKLAFEPGSGGRLVESYPDGSTFEIGRVRVWQPPVRLVFGWRQASFAADQETEVHVRFEALDGETRVTVEHFGWDTIPPRHAARHGFPLDVFQLRHAEWWRTLFASYRSHLKDPDRPILSEEDLERAEQYGKGQGQEHACREGGACLTVPKH
ncbi:MAG TPA: SRPBCC domain-containing protein [Gammaproteobacteria bacterium]|nr:SRPBCC domain-containing protein [Gammaproteobacteria bacterium]